ncbi:DUF6798 domain-containing protein [Candidatus Pelagibacter communis]|uniref:DUF6798 domain-containing protein n=1 Tax=Pelagibacter ubique TaxID=198252 RepID=UPI0015CF6CF5|nr:DUF6798 domain-containing protein [Candidatus Pelagibacter ubique]
MEFKKNYLFNIFLKLGTVKIGLISLGLLFLSIFTLFLKKNLISLKFDLLNLNFNIKIEIYFFIIVLFSLINFILFGKYTAFEWTTSQDIPILLRLIEPEILKNDFYVEGSINSPRIIFSHLIYYFNFFFNDWYFSLYLLKIIQVSFLNAILFLAMFKFSEVILNDKKKLIEINKFIFFLFSIGLFNFLQQESYVSGPFGWGAIQLHDSLSPMSISFIFGLIYNIVSCNNIRSNINYGVLFLIFSTFIHPTIGACHFALNLIFLFQKYFEISKIHRYLFELIIGLILPLVVLIFFFQSNSSINLSEFVESYVYTRHPHHYLMSEVINLNSFKWIFLFFLNLIIAYLTRSNKLIILSTVVLCFFVISPLSQFIFTEIHPVKQIIQLGPSRFTAYSLVIWVLSFSIITSNFIFQNKLIKFKKIKIFFILKYLFLSVVSFLIFLQSIFKIRILNFFLIIFAIFLIHLITFKYPLERELNMSKLIDWIKTNTHQESIFFAPSIDTFKIRVYANRAVFVDKAYPFNESYSKEYNKRFKILKNYKKLSLYDYKCINKLYDVDYLILKDEEYQFDEADYIKINRYNIYDLNELALEEKICNL